jgi:hypothetical protein
MCWFCAIHSAGGGGGAAVQGAVGVQALKCEWRPWACTRDCARPSSRASVEPWAAPYDMSRSAVSLCYAMLCYAMLYYAILCYARTLNTEICDLFPPILFAAPPPEPGVRITH